MSITLEISFFPWKPACWLRVQGPDALSFLQGQFSNDLRGLEARVVADDGCASAGGSPGMGLPLSESVYGLWLDRKGRILGDGFVLRDGEERFFICSYETEAAVLRAHLESFIIADEVEVFDETSGVCGLTLFLEEGGAAASLDLSEASLAFEGQRGAPGIEWVGSATARVRLMEKLDAKAELGAAEMERRRILGKIPAVPRDLGSRDLPQEGGAAFERAAVSYTKGCYLGQEVMSRLHTMGRVRRCLASIRSEGPVPTVLPASLYLGEKRVGELRSAVADPVDASGGFIGLALLPLHGLPTGDVRLSFRPNRPAEVTALLPTP